MYIYDYVSRCAWSAHCQVMCNTVARPCEKNSLLRCFTDTHTKRHRR